MLDRIFDIETELNENQVTLSAALVKHMIKHNRCGRRQLSVMPVKDKATGLVGLDINPPYDLADANYQQGLSQIQYDPKSKGTGFQMENPTVLGMWNQYGIELAEAKDVESMTMSMQVLAMKHAGRWIYWILKPADNETELEDRKFKAKRTAWLVRFGII